MVTKAPNTNPGHITEFTNDPADGHRLNGTCGETALEEAEAMASGGTSSIADMVRIYHSMRNHCTADGKPWADYNGASTLWSLARQAEVDGFKVALEWDYQQPFPHDWHQVLLDNAGKKAIVIQLANGQALTDIETGVADEVGLHYHFICVLDKQADGYRCSDGDSPEVGTRYEIYSYDTLSKAVPCGLLVLENKVAVDTSNLGPGFAAYAQAHGVGSKDGEHQEDDANGKWSWAVLTNGTVLFYSQATGVKDNMAGEVVERLHAKASVPAAPKLPPELHSVLANCANLLAPYADNRSAVVAVMKEFGY